MGKATRRYVVIGGIVAAAIVAIVAWFVVSIASTANQGRDLQSRVSAARASVAAFAGPEATSTPTSPAR